MSVELPLAKNLKEAIRIYEEVNNRRFNILISSLLLQQSNSKTK